MTERDTGALGVRGMNLEVLRSYSSGQTFDGPLGKSWDSPLFMKLADTGTNTTAFIMVGGVRKDTYTVTAYAPGSQTTQYATPPGFYVSLSKAGSGSSAVFTLTSANGAVTTFRWAFTRGGFNWYKLDKIVDPCGNQLAFTFCPHGRLVSMADSTGGVWTLTHVQSGVNEGRVATITTPWGASIAYGYSASGNLASVTIPPTDEYPSGSIYLYSYSGTKLTSIQEPGQSAPYLVNSYDAQNRVATQQLGSSTQTISINYSQYPKVVVTDRIGNTIENTVNPSSHQITNRTVIGTGSNPPQYTTLFSYNSDFLMTQRTWPSGAIESWTYDASSGNPRRHANMLEYRHRKSSQDVNGRWTTYTYNTTFNSLATMTSPRVNADSSISADPNYKLRMIYDAAGNLNRVDFPRVVDAAGQTHDANIIWQYDTLGRPTQVTDARGTQIQYTYLGSLPLPSTEVKDPTGIAATIARQYDSQGHLTHISSSCTCGGGADDVSFVYDARGQLREKHVKISATSEHVTTANYTANGRLTALKIKDASPVGNGWATTNIAYDLLGHVIASTSDVDVSNTITRSFAYDANEQLAQETLPDGRVIQYFYDARGLLTSYVGKGDPSTSSDDITWSMGYNADGELVTVTNPLGRTTTATRDGYGSMTAMTYADGSIGEMTWDTEDNLVVLRRKTAAGALCEEEDYSYDYLNQLIRVDRLARRSDGTAIGDGWLTTKAFYDASGNCTSVQSEREGTWTRVFDALNRLTSIRDGSIPANGFDVSYHPNGLPHVVTRVDGNTSTGTTTTWTQTDVTSYDQRGLPLQRKDGLGATTNYVYDIRGLLQSKTDPLGFKVDCTRDELGRILSVTHRKRTDGQPDADDVTTSYAYDSMSRLLSITAGNSPYSADQTTQFAYDPFGRRISTTYSDGAAISYQWSKSGKVVQRTDPRASTVTYSYDLLDQLVHIGIARGSGVTGETFVDYDVDYAGRKTRIENDSFKVVRAFNSVDGLEKDEIIAKDGSGLDLLTTAIYDSSGRLSRLYFPSDTSTSHKYLELTYDPSSRMTSLTQVDGLASPVTYSYSYVGSFLSSVNGGGVESKYSLDGNGALIGAQHVVNGTTRLDLSYVRDAAGMITDVRRTDYRADGTTIPYDSYGGCQHLTYDFLGRVKTSSFGISLADSLAGNYQNWLRNTTYNYDRVSNRTSSMESVVGGSSSTEIYASDSLNFHTNVGGTTATRDADGNLSTMGTFAAAFDSSNKPTSLTLPTGTMSVERDGLGRRIRTSSGSTVETIGYWGSGQVERSLANPTLISRQSLAIGLVADHAISFTDQVSGTRNRILDNGILTPLALCDASSNVTELYRYTTFGRRFLVDASNGTTQLGAASPSSNPVTFTGRLTMLNDADWLDFRARVYSTKLGRFAQVDPRGFGDGIANRYEFGRANPFALDPTGKGVPYIHEEDCGKGNEVAKTITGGKGLNADDLDAMTYEDVNMDDVKPDDDPDHHVDHADGSGGDTDAVETTEGYVAGGAAVGGALGGIPGAILGGIAGGAWASHIQEQFHAMGDEETKRAMTEWWFNEVKSTCRIDVLGWACHYVQDSVYHRDKNGQPYHAPAGHAVENASEGKINNKDLSYDCDDLSHCPGYEEMWASRRKEAQGSTGGMIAAFIENCGPNPSNGKFYKNYESGPVTTPNSCPSWWQRFKNYWHRVANYPPKAWDIDYKTPLPGIVVTGGRSFTFIPCMDINDVAFPIPDVGFGEHMDLPLGPPSGGLKFAVPFPLTTGGGMNSRKN